jgi:hypothetical protein
MSVTAPSITTPTPTSASTSSTDTRTGSLRRTTLVVGVVAAAIAAAVAAGVHAAGVPLEVEGEMIPLPGFAQMTFVGAVIGGLLLAVLNRRSAAPGRRFVQATVALTALSCVPSVAMPEDVATKVALVAIHLLAAAIVVPVLLRHAEG